MMRQLSDRVWRMQDNTESTAYLVVGDERAAMIDSGMGLEPLMPEIRRITRLPVVLLLTHAHPDHYGAAHEFDGVWLHEKDAALLPIFKQSFALLLTQAIPEDRLHTFGDDTVFDLGGMSLRAAPLAGHTPGSVIFEDAADRMLFMGDAIGSGYIVLMAVPAALCLSGYRRALATFADRCEGWRDYAWQGGHYLQAGQPGTAAYNPLRMQTVRDMITLCDGILSGNIQGEAVEEQFAPQGKALRAMQGAAGIVYTAEQVK